MIGPTPAQWLIGIAPIAPLLAIGWLAFDRDGRHAPLAAAIAAVPALLAALVAGGVAVEVSWILLGARLEVDETGRVLLVLTALLWLLAGVFAQGYLRAARPSFVAFWLLTMSGNLGLVLASDVVSFYVAFALMTFAAYGLVVHDRSVEAMRAGRVYVVMAMLAEVALLAGIIAAVWATGALDLGELRSGLGAAEHREIIIGLLLAGFGVKAGVITLHMWLPLAHPAAPVPASAVLSGAMIKAGVLGWLRFVPLEESTAANALDPWGAVLVAVGVAGAFLAVLAGLPHRDPKVTLAYSSVSQMGVLTMIVGVGFAAPEAGRAVVLAVAVYALHHGLAKGALFLGVPLAGATGTLRWLVIAGLALAALAIAGGPMTSGLVAKALLKDAAGEGGAAGSLVLTLLPLTSIATTLLLARYLVLIVRAPPLEERPSPWTVGAWAATTASALLLIWLAPPQFLGGVDAWAQVYPSALVGATWPVLAGVALAVPAAWLGRRGGLPRIELPPGDLIVLIERALTLTARGWFAVRPHTIQLGATTRRLTWRLAVVVFAGDTIERWMSEWMVAGALFLAVIAALALLGSG